MGVHRLKIRDICMDLEPSFKVHNLVVIHINSTKLGHGGIWVPYWILLILVFAGRSKRMSLKPQRAKEKPWRPEHTGTPWEYALFAQSCLFF